MSPDTSRGSEWSRWDLHVHSPQSIVQHYGEGGGDPWANFLDDLEALPPEFRVIGINDYLFLDGYKRVLEEKAAGRLKNLDLILPVIELRLNHFGGTDGDLSRINLHVIFSNDLAADVIQSQFVNGLKCDLTMLPQGASASDWSSLPTRQTLSDLGRSLKETLPEPHRSLAGSDLHEGFFNFNVTFESVIDLLERPVFRNRYFLAIGKVEWADLKWTKQSAAFKKTLINRPHFVFTATDTPANFSKSRKALKAHGVNDRLLDCSDAHFRCASSNTNRIGNALTWICAAPSFEGLRHAYHEYETRVFVGDLPPKLQSIRSNPTQYLECVTIYPVVDNPGRPSFNIELPLNPGFIAIVGNKGKGKSALTDVLGLVGNSHRSGDFSFLTRARYRYPRRNLAAQHVGSARWVSGATVERSLDVDCDTSAPDFVQYLPQNFLESVCNEAPGADELFSKELGEVIFSHVPEADRLGASDLRELVALRTGATRRKIDILRSELAMTIDQIVELEAHLDPRVRAALQTRLEAREAELTAHDQARPSPVAEPSDSEEKSLIEQTIEQLRGVLAQLESELQALQAKANEKSRLLETAQELRKELTNLEHQLSTASSRLEPMSRELGLTLDELISLKVDTTKLDELRRSLSSERDAANDALSITQDGTPARRALEARAELQDSESRLDAPQRAYQTYLSNIEAWEKQRLTIVGTKETPDSVTNLRFRLDQLSEAPARLEALKATRLQQALQIHSELQDIVAKLRDIYRPVQEFVASHPVVRDRFNLSFQVTIIARGFAEKFLSMINRQVSGSFAGADEGAARVERSLSETDFDSPDSVREFLESIDVDLHHDNRSGRASKATLIVDQLRKDASAEGLLRYLFGLEYLSPEYWLESEGRPIAQLSPGQRGTLLLLFYLLVDKASRPIILDQPEENLDNQTVHELLVPAIAEARQRRQVIAVTHNPNLAVVGDADQVVVAEMTANQFVYVSGAIEDPSINGRIVEILEGTWPAFANRRDKYVPTAVLEASSG